MWWLLGLFGAGAGLAYLASKSVPEGALPGCAFNEHDLDLWGRANGIHVMVDGTHAVGSPNERYIVHWETGSRVLMVNVGETWVADWHAVNSYCRYNLAQGSATGTAPNLSPVQNINPNTFKLANKVRNAKSAELPNWVPPGGFKVG